jgi:hypothetical protein
MSYRFGCWAGSPKGHSYRDGFCAEEVPKYAGSFLYKQCSRKNGHGPAGLYCRQHAKRYPGPVPR